jgi:hypothetical protein
MKSSISPNRFVTLRDACLKRIRSTGPFIEGSLVGITRPGSSHTNYRLTSKVKGKTKAVYVPVDLVEEVILWTKNYKALKGLVRQVTKHSEAILRRHVRAKRGGPQSAKSKIKRH